MCVCVCMSVCMCVFARLYMLCMCVFVRKQRTCVFVSQCRITYRREFEWQTKDVTILIEIVTLLPLSCRLLEVLANTVKIKQGRAYVN